MENPIKIHVQMVEGQVFGDPRLTTLIRGLYQFESTFFGWKLALGLLVCTP
jgi:hypothetical protein